MRKLLALPMIAIAVLLFVGCPNGNGGVQLPTYDGEVMPGTVGDFPKDYKNAVAVAKVLDPEDEKVILFYFRKDGNYSPWGLWLWPDGGDGKQGYTDTDGKFQTDSETGLGYIILDSSVLSAESAAHPVPFYC